MPGKAEDRSRLRAMDVLVSAVGVFAEGATRSTPSGRSLCTKPQGRRGMGPLSSAGLALTPPKNTEGTSFQRGGGPRAGRGCPSTGFPPASLPACLPSRQPLEKSVLLSFLLPFHNTTLLCCRTRAKSAGEKPGGSDLATQPPNRTLTGNPFGESHLATNPFLLP